MRRDEYARHDALGLGALLGRGEVTPLEVIGACESIVERFDGRLNAVVSRHFDLARAAATSLSGNAPFFGTPFGAKEEGAYYSGVASGASSRLVPPADPGYDTVFVTRYKAAGLNLVAKLNMPELAASVTTESAVNGICRNPWNLERSAGGSSGGSAAAVAAGYVPAAYGNDGAGSIRIPASCCGVFGFKPSRGRVPKGPVLNDEWAGNVVDHVITRSVRDSAAILDVSAGIDVGAPYDAPPGPASFLGSVGRADRPLRIGFSTASPTGGPVHPDCVAATLAAAKLCEGIGHEVVPAAPDLDGEEMFARLFDLMSAHIAKEARALFALRRIAPQPDYLEPANYDLLQRGLNIKAVDYLDTLMVLGRIARRAAVFFETFDIWLCPTLARPNVVHGQISALGTAKDTWRRWAEFAPFTPLANIAGQPAMSIPLHWNAEGMPVGVHFQARFGNEAALFGLAGQLEQALPWIDRIPPISARAAVPDGSPAGRRSPREGRGSGSAPG